VRLSSTPSARSRDGCDALGQGTPQASRTEGSEPSHQPLWQERHLARQGSLEKAHLRETAQQQASPDGEAPDCGSGIMVYSIVGNLLDDKEVPDDAKAKGR
jgi:hypothetical protein